MYLSLSLLFFTKSGHQLILQPTHPLFPIHPTHLLGGWTKPSEKYYIVKMRISPPIIRGEHQKIFETLPTQKNLQLMPNQTFPYYMCYHPAIHCPTPRGFLWHFLHHAVELRGWGLVEARCLLQSHRTNPKACFSFGRWNGGHAVGVVFIIRFGKGGPLLKGSNLGIVW